MDTQNRNKAPLPVPLELHSKKRQEDEAWSRAHTAMVEIDSRKIDKDCEYTEVWEEQ